jgi:hypothetical protein
MTFRFEVIDIRTRAPEGDRPYVDVGRCLMRVHWLNLTAQELRYTLRPVRWVEESELDSHARSSRHVDFEQKNA